MNLRKVLAILLLVYISGFAKGDMSNIGIYVSPYYDSKKPTVKVGKYSKGLASKDEKVFSKTILEMKQNLQHLNSIELYIASIRLYDMGYRDESVYWFYLAQMQSRVFANILDRKKVGKMGSFSFELYQANTSFYQLSGPFINGYAFKDMDKLVKVLKNVKDKKITYKQMQTLYPKAKFIPKSKAIKVIHKVFGSIDGFIDYIKKDSAKIKQQREKSGISAKYKNIKSKPFKGGFAVGF